MWNSVNTNMYGIPWNCVAYTIPYALFFSFFSQLFMHSINYETVQASKDFLLLVEYLNSVYTNLLYSEFRGISRNWTEKNVEELGEIKSIPYFAEFQKGTFENTLTRKMSIPKAAGMFMKKFAKIVNP
jgi:hypothetical protein